MLVFTHAHISNIWGRLVKPRACEGSVCLGVSGGKRGLAGRGATPSPGGSLCVSVPSLHKAQDTANRARFGHG
jgi:hypothetical protein